MEKNSEDKFLSINEISESFGLDTKLLKKFVPELPIEDRAKVKNNNVYNIQGERFQRLIKYGQGGYITKTTALTDYKLKQAEVESLVFKEIKNPNYSKAAPMKLLLKKEVEEFLTK